MDYYFSSSLRSQQECKNLFYQIHCQLNCGKQTGVCVDKACFCVQVTSTNIKTDSNSWQSNSLRFYREDDKENFDDFDENAEAEPPTKSLRTIELEPLNYRPTVRHHIAHFCPNLDVARECIKKCMKVGKPAFCGKDHVCYCGHRYTNNDKEPDAKASDIYAEFKDMYKKYFGGDSEANKNIP